MNRFKKEYLLFAIAFVVAIVGLLQLSHEVADATTYCSQSICKCTEPPNCENHYPCWVYCPAKGYSVPIDCGWWCGCGPDPCVENTPPPR